jgi:DNA modification methylase
LGTGRNSIGIEIDPDYFRYAANRLKEKNRNLFSKRELVFQEALEGHKKGIYIETMQTFY